MSHASALGSPRSVPLSGLLWTLVRTDFKSRYHGSLQGFAWALVKPLAIFVVLMAVFSFVFGNEQGYSIKLILGLFLWDFFSDSTKTGITSLATKGYLLTKARLPSWIFVVSSMSNAAITLFVFSAILLTYLAVTGRAPSFGRLMLFGWYILQFGAIVTGISLAGSALFLKYRDLNQVWDVITQAGFFVAPIIYPLRILPESTHFYLYFWPPTPVIQFSRDVLIDGTVPTLRAHLLLAGGAGVILLVGWMIFAARSHRIAEEL
jgi:lipopolysaccharide transport system permease protein